MPTGISHSVVTPAALAQRGTAEPGQTAQRSRDTAASSPVGNAQASPAAGDELLRAPDPGASSQGAENQVSAETTGALGAGKEEATGGSAAPEPAAGSPGPSALTMNAGIGGNVDIVI